MQKVLGGLNGERTFSTVPGLSTADQSLVQAIDGQHIKLTLDRDIQWFAQEAIAAQVQATQAKSGVVIVMNPKTGEILALATAPTFDPNNIIGVDTSLLGNRAVSDAFEPGSTGKVITLAAALEEGKVSLSSKFKIPSGLRRGDKRFTDSHAHNGLKLTLTGIMAHSSNIGSILVSEKLSDTSFYDYLKKFGIGQKTKVQLPAESSGSLPQVSEWSGTTKPTLSFGQGYSLNALQAMSIFATIANDGVRVQPTIIQGIQDWFEVTQHAICNIHMELDGHTAHTEAYLIAYHKVAATRQKVGDWFGENYLKKFSGWVDEGVTQDFIYGGRYVDRLEKRNGVWRIAKRTVVMDWNLNQPSTEIRSDGMFKTLQIIGQRNHSDPIYQK
jgi:membrane carboxypeptidase/penicillin-binding protein